MIHLVALLEPLSSARVSGLMRGAGSGMTRPNRRVRARCCGGVGARISCVVRDPCSVAMRLSMGL